MSKLLEKALKDATKEKKCIFGAKEVLGSLKDSKLVVVSKSAQKNSKKIGESAKNEKVQTVQFKGSSVALGRLCGVQFRVSIMSLTSIADTNIKSILNENEKEWLWKQLRNTEFMKV